MKLVIMESPYAGRTPEEIARNVDYARRCLRDSLLRGESPLASHLLFTQPGVLRDEIPEERRHGIEAGLAWGKVAETAVVYTDLGLSPGMIKGIQRHLDNGIPVEYRQIGPLTIPCAGCGERDEGCAGTPTKQPDLSAGQNI